MSLPGENEINAWWVTYLPGMVRTRLQGRRGVQAVVSNSGWLVADKVARLGVGLPVGIWVVRYLGPAQFGLLSYAIAFAGLLGAFAGLGLDRIVVQELVRQPDRQAEVIGSAFVLKLIAGLATLAVTIFAIVSVRGGEPLMYWLVGITAAGFVFQSLNVIDFFFQAKVRAKYAVFAGSGAFALATVAKIIMLLLRAPLIAFAWIGLVEVALSAALLTAAYRLNRENIGHWRYSAGVARRLLASSWPLMLSGFAVMIYMRIDQIMIGQMLGDTGVGLFSAAVRLSEAWYFVPMAIATSVVPTLVQTRERSEALYYARLRTLFSALVWLGISVAVIVTLAKDMIVDVVFGAPYAGSAMPLAIHVWGGVFVGLGVASGVWFTVENLQKYSFYRTMSGCVINVILNAILIPRYGISGAALATVVAQVLAAFLFDLVSTKTRVIFWLKVQAFNPLSAIPGRTTSS